MKKPLKKPIFWPLFGVILALGVVLLGAYTRLVDAGLGCPDWPGCYGKLLVPNIQNDLKAQSLYPHIPFNADKAWPEMIHRSAAGVLGIIVVILAMLAWRRRHEKHAPFLLSFFLVGLVILQALFGMWTVTHQLLPWIVVLHLLGGVSTLGLLWLIFLRWRPASLQTLSPISPLFAPWVSALLMFVLIQVGLGGWTSAHYAALACPDFPTCLGKMIPPLSASAFSLAPPGPNYEGGLLTWDLRATIHFVHRLGALFCLLLGGGVSLSLILSAPRRFARLGGLLLGLLILQVLLGVFNVLWVLPLWIALSHTACATFLLLTLITLRYALYCHANIRSL